MNEKKYDPYIEPPFGNESAMDLIKGLDKTKTFVISEDVVNQYAQELAQETKKDSSIAKEVGQHYLVGEHHAQRISNKRRQEFVSSLDNSGVVIVEGQYTSEQLSGDRGKSYMGEAQIYATEKGKTIYYLNSELDKYYRVRSALWLEKGVLNPEVNVPTLEGLSVCIHYLSVEHKAPEVIRKAIAGFTDITTGMAVKKELGVTLTVEEQERAREVTTNVEKVFNYALSNEEGMSQLISILLDYNAVDGAIRDTAYNWCIQNIIKINNNKPAVVVVGKNHFQAGELALKEERVSEATIKATQQKAGELFVKLNNLLSSLQPIPSR